MAGTTLTTIRISPRTAIQRFTTRGRERTAAAPASIARSAAPEGGAVTRKGENGGRVGVGDGGNVYAGKDGNVYRKQDGNWQKYDNGGWSTTDRQPSGERPQPTERSSGTTDRSTMDRSTTDQLN